MSRFGKKTLYLDLEALKVIEAALNRLPGRPSLSSFFNEQLPTMAKLLDEMVTTAEKGGLRGIADMLLGAAKTAEIMVDGLEADVKKTLQSSKNPDKPLLQTLEAIPPKKVRKTAPKKVVQT
jgi:hypothetical protein